MWDCEVVRTHVPKESNYCGERTQRYLAELWPLAFFLATRAAFDLADLLRHPELRVFARMLHVIGQCTSLLVALQFTLVCIA